MNPISFVTTSQIPRIPSPTYQHPSNIFLKTPISVPFSNAAATRSLSPNCRFTCSAVLCVPSLILTSTLNLGGSACSKRTRTPRPMTVAREQCVIVGVTRTVTVVICGEVDGKEEGGRVGVREMSGRLTTEREPRVSGCSGSWIWAMRSMRGGRRLVSSDFAKADWLRADSSEWRLLCIALNRTRRRDVGAKATKSCVQDGKATKV